MATKRQETKVLSQMDQIRMSAESSLSSFIKLVHPQRVLGAIHEEIINWWTRQDALRHQLLLLPRDHGKSALVAYRAAWEITKNPAVRILYISATSNLANKQLKFIKDILESPIYRRYWPDMIEEDKGQREKWTENEISIDHPKRKLEAVRDPTVFAGGLTTVITGLHFDIAVLDDVVIKENAYDESGREKVSSQYSLLASIEGADAYEWAVGTRYHPKDLYSELMQITVNQYDNDGNFLGTHPLYEVFERKVEDVGDGSGEYIWPRQRRADGKYFGFDRRILEEKKSKYIDKVQFRAQYYNDPNDFETATIQADMFNYYNPDLLRRLDGQWYYGSERLNVFAAVDFAFSTSKDADSTSIVVVGVDRKFNIYVLDIERFKTDRISEYFARILKLHQKWDFRKIRAETTVAQKVIVNDLKENYIRMHGLALYIDEVRPIAKKEERIEAALQPRYANGQMWHYRGGNCQVLEEELVLQNPPHDDVKDCLASVVEICVAPLGLPMSSSGTSGMIARQQLSNPRFGGFY